MSSNLGNVTPEIFQILLLKFMWLYLLQNTCSSPMNVLYAFPFTTLSETNTSNAQTANRKWYNMFYGAPITFMRETTKFLRNQGIPPTKYWSESDTNLNRYTDFIYTLLRDRHKVISLILTISPFIDHNCARLDRHGFQYQHLPLAFIHILNAYMIVFFSSTL